MEVREYCVYILTCRITGLHYVGKTNDFNRRMNEHGYASDGETKLQQAIRDYGWSSFNYHIHMSNLTLDEARKVEARMIMNLNSYIMGYNMTHGG